jgi:RimJ/RimL family protein N-acetyltransferase/ADP-ribose pyrophosphatase YjhB (NUDIX family)
VDVDNAVCRPLPYGAPVSVPSQPTLRDGEVVLRPWTFDDVAAARLHSDLEVRHGVGFPAAPQVPPAPTAPQVPPAPADLTSGDNQRQAIENRHRGYAAGRRVVSFLVEYGGRVAGTVEVRQEGDGNGQLAWAVFPDHRGQGVGTRAVRLLIGYAFEELGLHRVAAYVERDDRASLRTAGRVGLRREGIVRAARERRGARGDYVLLARLVTDPEPTSGGGFIAVLNAGLPTKRVIAQGLILNSAGEILLCELTYKQEWDLPGGVVDPHESPAQAVVREIGEEMQVEVSPLSLVAVNWLPPWRGWDDATLFVFDLGVDDDVIARARLEPRELLALHWCTLDQVERRAAPYVTRMLRRLAQQREGTAYLEDGADPSW